MFFIPKSLDVKVDGFIYSALHTRLQLTLF
jgi:hypothetical protein